MNLKICIDARIISGLSGGIEQVIIGLAHGLSKLKDDAENYIFLTYPDSRSWLEPYTKDHFKIINTKTSPPKQKIKKFIKASIPGAKKVWDNFGHFLGSKSIKIPTSDGTIEKEKVDVVHFVSQNAFLTEIPSIYHPHDLQHIHLPHFFKARQRLEREMKYQAFCKRAKMIAVASEWTKKDIIKQYNISEEKIETIPLAPAINSYADPGQEDILQIQKKYSLPNQYILYPAQTWPHKNHLGLLETLAILRDKYHLKYNLISTGLQNDFFSTISKRIDELGLNDQVRFLGFLPPLDLKCLYKLSHCVVIPTKFEAGSFPLWEAFQMGIPAACSNVTSLPQQAGDAALIFNPENYEEMADKIKIVWENKTIRTSLIDRGKKQVLALSWEKAAKIFRSHYRRIGNRPLTSEDFEFIKHSHAF